MLVLWGRRCLARLAGPMLAFACHAAAEGQLFVSAGLRQCWSRAHWRRGRQYEQRQVAVSAYSWAVGCEYSFACFWWGSGQRGVRRCSGRLELQQGERLGFCAAATGRYLRRSG